VLDKHYGTDQALASTDQERKFKLGVMVCLKIPNLGLIWAKTDNVANLKLGYFPANLLINQGIMATLQERRLGSHSRAGLEPVTSEFSTLRINHYATNQEIQIHMH
jgi:hypothetical protein